MSKACPLPKTNTAAMEPSGYFRRRCEATHCSWKYALVHGCGYYVKKTGTSKRVPVPFCKIMYIIISEDDTMNNQAYNPYLPECEYIPDGEPYLFGDRVYVYGSHDKFGAPIFCVGDYVCYSAPVDDLSDWRYEGVIYKKSQDPKSMLGLRLLFAPDVCIGPDGRYYLYYAYDMMGIMGVAVADSPVGPFEYLGHVHYPDGTIWGRKKGDSFPFDPGVLVDDDGRVWLYSGYYSEVPAIVTGGIKLKAEGGYVLELEQDMVTIRTPEKLIFPKEGPGSFANHEFFEASSIREYDDLYYFVYSSRHNHELCYAVSDRPDGGFAFMGTLVSNSDVFYDGNEDELHANNYSGNTHGGLLRLGSGEAGDEKWYIFYHRQTDRSSYARQACAEELKVIRRPETGIQTLKEDETSDKLSDRAYHFTQSEMTSCGLNGGPLVGCGSYPAYIACNLWAKGHTTGRVDGPHHKGSLKDHPYFTQCGHDGADGAYQYIANMRDGATAGFKYFDAGELKECRRITVEVRINNKTGDGSTKKAPYMVVSGDEAGDDMAARISLASAKMSGISERCAGEWISYSAEFHYEKNDEDITALYFSYEGSGAMDFKNFTME